MISKKGRLEASIEPFDENVAADIDTLLPYAGLQVKSLTTQEERFVHMYVSGMTASQAAVASGYSTRMANTLLTKEPIVRMITLLQQRNRDKMEFTVEKAHVMYMDAYAAAKDATEMKMVIDSLVKLHGVMAPPKVQKVDVNITSRALERMPDSELLKQAGMDENYLLPKREERPNRRRMEDEPHVEGEFTEVGESIQNVNKA